MPRTMQTEDTGAKNCERRFLKRSGLPKAEARAAFRRLWPLDDWCVEDCDKLEVHARRGTVDRAVYTECEDDHAFLERVVTVGTADVVRAALDAMRREEEDEDEDEEGEDSALWLLTIRHKIEWTQVVARALAGSSEGVLTAVIRAALIKPRKWRCGANEVNWAAVVMYAQHGWEALAAQHPGLYVALAPPEYWRERIAAAVMSTEEDLLGKVHMAHWEACRLPQQPERCLDQLFDAAWEAGCVDGTIAAAHANSALLSSDAGLQRLQRYSISKEHFKVLAALLEEVPGWAAGYSAAERASVAQRATGLGETAVAAALLGTAPAPEAAQAEGAAAAAAVTAGQQQVPPDAAVALAPGPADSATASVAAAQQQQQQQQQGQEPPLLPAIKLEAISSDVREYYDLAFKSFDGDELAALRDKFMHGHVPEGGRSNLRRAADKGSRTEPLALREHGHDFWKLLSAVAQRADGTDGTQQRGRKRGGSSSGGGGEPAGSSGGGGEASAANTPQVPPPLPWAGATQGLPQLSPSEQLLWWLRCLDLHWRTCHRGQRVLGVQSEGASGSGADGVTEVVDLTEDQGEEEEAPLADVAAWLEANGGCVVTSVKEGTGELTSSKRIKLEEGA